MSCAFLLTLALVLPVTGCGNKGDLYLEADAAIAKELEDAAEKLKKERKTEPASPASMTPGE